MEEAWSKRERLLAEGTCLEDKGNCTWAEGERLIGEGYLLKTKAERECRKAEGKRLRAKGDRLLAEGECRKAEGILVVLVTAQALYGLDVVINWEKRTTSVPRKSRSKRLDIS